MLLNPIPTSHGRNQPIYECHVTTAGRNRVKEVILIHFTEIDKVLNSELWDSSLQVYFISCSGHDTRQVFEF